MHNKDKYINNVISRFSGNAKDILLKQIDLFYAVDNQITKNRYNIGDDVKLKKGTFIHGIFGELENFLRLDLIKYVIVLACGIYKIICC